MTAKTPHATAPTARFIVGMPRAATTWLCKCLNEHPQAAAFGESMYFGRRFLPPQPDGTYTPAQVRTIARRLSDGTCLQSTGRGGPGSLKNISAENLPRLVDAALENLSQRPTPADVFAAFIAEVAAVEEKQCAIEKTPHHLNWLDRIFTAFPDARVVALLREPYAFMLSYKHQGDRKAEAHRKQLQKLYHPLACALVWRASMRSALAARAGWPRQVHFCDQQDITADPAAVLNAVQQFFVLEPVDLAAKVPQDNTSFPAGVRPELEAEDIFWMNLIAGRTIRQAGYARQGIGTSPKRLIRIAWSVLRLPIWSVGCLLTLRQKVDGSLTKYILRWFRPAQPKPASTD